MRCSLLENDQSIPGTSALHTHVSEDALVHPLIEQLYQAQASHGRLQYASDFEIASILAAIKKEGSITLPQDIGSVYTKTTLPQWDLYYCFCRAFLAAHVDKKTFETYWKQLVDPSIAKKKRSRESPYKEELFRTIAAHIDAGKPPQKQKRGPKQGRSSKKSVTSISQHEQRKIGEVQLILEEMAPILDQLVALLGQSRSGYAPDRLSAYAQVIRQGQKRIQGLKIHL
jgi:hypothetical protein